MSLKTLPGGPGPADPHCRASQAGTSSFDAPLSQQSRADSESRSPPASRCCRRWCSSGGCNTHSRGQVPPARAGGQDNKLPDPQAARSVSQTSSRPQQPATGDSGARTVHVRFSSRAYRSTQTAAAAPGPALPGLPRRGEVRAGVPRSSISTAHCSSSQHPPPPPAATESAALATARPETTPRQMPSRVCQPESLLN